MPPTTGAAIGCITSTPVRVLQKIGSKRGDGRRDGHDFRPETQTGSGLEQAAMQVGLENRGTAPARCFRDGLLAGKPP